MSDLKQTRISKGLTQEAASAILGVSLRSYKSYENDESKSGSMKYNYMLDILSRHVALDEDHGILTLEEIKRIAYNVFQGYPVKYCILFGSYAKGKATDQSDVDLLISGEVTGLKFFGLVEALRQELHKRVDLLDLKQLNNNPELIDEILKDGIRIYERA